MSRLIALSLHNFRSYTGANLQGLASGFVVLTGANGAGKTNILEAVSLLTPGRGLRGVDYAELQQIGAAEPWVVAAQTDGIYGEIPIGLGFDTQKNKRIIKIKGQPARGATEMAEYFSALWLTPAMDRLFMEASSNRRRFLDRMVYTLAPAQAGLISRYEVAQNQRLKLLKLGNMDPQWLSGLEDQMARYGTAIAAARNHFIEQLTQVLQQNPVPHFPQIQVKLEGEVEAWLYQFPAIEVEDKFRAELAARRPIDAATGRSGFGTHKTDLQTVYADKNMPAARSSTGEQKTLLMALVLSHAALVKGQTGRAPVLLLDEAVAHLDSHKKQVVFSYLAGLDGQYFLTGTDAEFFKDLPQKAQFWRVENGQVELCE